MSLFKKNKAPTLKKASKEKSKTKLSKYLPTILFVGIQEDINEKALISYITSLAQSAFPNVREAKYSIKKLGKNKYLYEIHNGSDTLTYLPLVVSKVIEGSGREVILKTNSQNVRVAKKTATRIETNTLIESNNRDDDALVDYESKGKMKYLIKQGTEVFIVSAIAASITGVIAGVSFLSKYYMLNEDYSYNPVIEDIMTAHDFLNTIESEHSQTKYVDNIRFVNSKWITNFKEIELPPEPVIVEEVEEPVVEEKQELIEVRDETVVENTAVEKTEDVNLNTAVNPIDSKPIVSEQVNVEDINNSIPDVSVKTVEPVSKSESVDENEDIQKDESFDPFKEKEVLDTNENLSEKDMTSETSDEFAIPDEPSAKTDKQVDESVVDESVIENEIIEAVEESTKEMEKAVLEEKTIDDDSFEIIDAADIKSLDLTNISEDDIVLE